MKTKILLFTISMGIVCMAYSQNVPENWFLDEVNPGEDIALSWDGENVQDGIFSCKMELLQPEVPYLISDNFNVNEGDLYTFSIWYFDNDSRASLKIYAEFYDAEGNDIYGEDPVYSEDGELWHSISWAATVPDGAVEGYIWIKLYHDEGYVDEATVWVDNAKFIVDDENLVVNGSFENWEGVGIGEPNSEQNQISVFPNPVIDFVTISNLQQIDHIEILNSMGQVIKSVQTVGLSNMKLDLTGLNTGLYFVVTYDGQQIATSRKILKK